MKTKKNGQKKIMITIISCRSLTNIFYHSKKTQIAVSLDQMYPDEIFAGGNTIVCGEGSGIHKASEGRNIKSMGEKSLRPY